MSDPIASLPPPPELTARRVDALPAPDGDVAKPPWRDAVRVRFDHDWSGVRHPDAPTEVAVAWTPSAVGFAFSCRYDALHLFAGEDPALERWEMWTRDVAEVFLNVAPGQADRYFELEVAPTNQWIDLAIDLRRTPRHDAGWSSGFAHATRVDAAARVWTCEMRVPLAALGIETLRPGDAWRVGLYRCDGGAAGAPRRYLAWSPTGTPAPDFHVPHRFGWLRFAA